jgi:hypothetical protein
MWGCFEAEGNRIADIEVADSGSGRFDTLRLGHNRTNGIGKSMNASRSWDDGGGFCRGHDAIVRRTSRTFLHSDRGAILRKSCKNYTILPLAISSYG